MNSFLMGINSPNVIYRCVCFVPLYCMLLTAPRHTVPPSQAGHSRHLHTQPQQQQQQQAPAIAAGSSGGSNGGSTSPLQIHTPHPALADFLATPSPQSPTDLPSLSPTATAAAAGTAAAIAAGTAAEISFDSEDVPVSELLLAGGHGVWAPHASLAPQLNAISEESVGSSGVLIDGYGSSGGSNGSSSDGSSGSWEVLEAPGGSAAASEQQQQQQMKLEPQMESSSVAAAAAAAAEGPPASGRPRSQGRRVSFSSEVTSSDDDKQQQQQQQQHLETQQQQQQSSHVPDPQQQQQQQQGDAVSGDLAADGVCGDSEEARGVGAVGWEVYASYFKAVGVAMCCAVLGSLIAMQVRPTA
jgi:hypothetical protein